MCAGCARRNVDLVWLWFMTHILYWLPVGPTRSQRVYRGFRPIERIFAAFWLMCVPHITEHGTHHQSGWLHGQFMAQSLYPIYTFCIALSAMVWRWWWQLLRWHLTLCAVRTAASDWGAGLFIARARKPEGTAARKHKAKCERRVWESVSLNRFAFSAMKPQRPLSHTITAQWIATRHPIVHRMQCSLLFYVWPFAAFFLLLRSSAPTVFFIWLRCGYSLCVQHCHAKCIFYNHLQKRIAPHSACVSARY